MEEIFSVIPDDYFGPDDDKKGDKEEDDKNIIKDVVNVIKVDGSFIDFLKYYLQQFLSYGSREHFWFFPAVFFSIILVTIFAKLGLLQWLAILSLLAYGLGLLGCSYYGIGNYLPVIGHGNGYWSCDYHLGTSVTASSGILRCKSSTLWCCSGMLFIYRFSNTTIRLRPVRSRKLI